MHLTFDSAGHLADALRRAAHAHGRHQEDTGRADPDWPGWYARFLEREQASGRKADHPAAQPQRFTHLPERVDPKQTVTSHPTHPARDPEAGRDTDRDFLLRYGAGGDEWDVGGLGDI